MVLCQPGSRACEPEPHPQAPQWDLLHTSKVLFQGRDCRSGNEFYPHQVAARRMGNSNAPLPVLGDRDKPRGNHASVSLC